METTQTAPMPRIASHSEWLAERKRLLVDEKASTKEKDRINAERRRLPMVKVDKVYEFDTSQGKKSLSDLFEGRKQLIVYHFMFDPEWEKGCPGCTGYADSIGDISMLSDRDTTFTLISRAPLEKLEATKREKGWKLNWASSLNSDFNYDFHATLDESKAPIEYNFEDKDALLKKMSPESLNGEQHGHSVFFRDGDDIYHTYSAYARSTEGLSDAYGLLDITPYGRQEDFEDSPEGWPQRPTYE
ncbi:MAG: DUF899 domain-containing protein [Armatimonadota bacterium]|nr:DUF899 domain-containing protein [Armatimonadota bacterium]